MKVKNPINMCPDWFLDAMGYSGEPLAQSEIRKIVANHQVVGLNISDKPAFEPKSPMLTLKDVDTLKEKSAAIEDQIKRLCEVKVMDDPCFSRYGTGWLVWRNDMWHPVEPPQNKVMLLDTETMQSGGKWYPMVAIALTLDGEVFCWVNDGLLGDCSLLELIPLGKGNLVVAHNANYDRQFIQSEYDLGRPPNHWLCTMSMVTCVRGIGNQQRGAFLLQVPEPWVGESTTASLADAYQFYTGKKLSKDTRNDIIENGINLDNIVSILTYCYLDVLATKELLSHVWYEYRKLRPNGFSLLGMLTISTEILPLSQRWLSYAANAEQCYHQINSQISSNLWEIAQTTLGQPQDVWSSRLDWTLLKAGKNKGLPKWFAKLKATVDKGEAISPSIRESILLMKLTYNGQPVVWYQRENSQASAWCFEDGTPIPHPETPGQRVTSMMTKAFVELFDDGTIVSTIGLSILDDLVSTLNWKSLKERVSEVSVKPYKEGMLVIPQFSNIGTVTGRKSDKLWVVVPNAKKNRIGTELKSMIEAPLGKHFVSFDIDSEELRIFGLIGDAVSGIAGMTPLSASTLMGSKSDGDDPHTIISQKMGISRNDVKPLVYGSIYAMGKQGAINYLLKVSKGMTKDEAEEKVNQFQDTLKGSRYYGTYSNGLGSDSFNRISSSIKGLPRTVFGSILPYSLQQADKYTTSKFNWVIQASGRDFLDLLVSLIDWQIESSGLDARLCLTVHDECHWLCSDKDVDKLVDIVYHSHALCWTVVCDNLGLSGIPLNLLYPESIAIDKYIRKSPYDTCVTPSHTVPLPPGKEITFKDWLTHPHC